jgi:hypothetical protein
MEVEKMMACLLAELRTNRGKIRTNRTKIDANQAQTGANLREITFH